MTTKEAKDTIYRQDAIDALCKEGCGSGYCGISCVEVKAIEQLTSADSVSKKDVLGWLLAYHTKSFDLKGRYYPHEVIGWLVADISKNLFADMRGEQDK